MTVRHLKILLKGFNDDDRIILDNGNYQADCKNEILYAFKLKASNESDYKPVVILQTREDIDVCEELSAYIEHSKANGMTKDDVINELLEIGYTETEINQFM